MTIIADLWNGRLEPIRNLGNNNEEIKHLEDLLQRNIEDLEKLENKENEKIFSKFNDNVTEYTTLIAEQAFCDGFSLGVKFIAEALLAP